MRTKVWDEAQQKWVYLDSDDNAPLIDDGQSSPDTTYSSKKVDELVGNRASKVELNRAVQTLSATDAALRKDVNSKAVIDDTANERETVLSSRESANRFANAFVGNQRGVTVAVDDVDPFRHDVKCTIESINMIPFPYREETVTRNGVTWTVNDDKTITVSGIPTSYSHFQVFFKLKFSGSGEYTFYGYDNMENVTADVTFYDENGDLYINVEKQESGVPIEITGLKSGFVSATLKRKSNGVECKGTAKPVFTKGKSYGMYFDHVSDLEKIKLYQSGKNLLDDRAFLACGFEQIGDHEFVNKDGNAANRKVLLENPSRISGVFTIRFLVKYINKGSTGKECVYPEAVFTDGTTYPLRPIGYTNTEYMLCSFVSPPGKIVDNIFFVYFDDGESYFKNFEVCYGAPDETFTPNDMSIFSPDESGLVTGMVSKGNVMVVLSDTPGTVTNIQYNKDPNVVVQKLTDRIAALEAKQTNI